MATFKTVQESKHQIIAQERLYLNRDQTRVVKDGDKEAAFLFAAAGQPIPLALARKYGLVEEQAAPPSPTSSRNRRIATPEATR